MRIAHVSPLYESVPPKLYGGTERVVSHLVEGQVRQGHEVTLFASGDSVTSARLAPMCGQALRLDPSCVEDIPHHVFMLEKVMQMAGEFDIVHFHTGVLHFPLARRLGVPHVTTMHGRLDLDLKTLAAEFDDLPLVSISDSQRKPLPFMNWVATIHHGLPLDLLTFSASHQGYLAFLGRVSPEKRVDRAIKMALASGVPLKIAAKIDKRDQDYYESIKPLFDHPLVEYVGEIGEADKSAFLGGAMALLFPIDWPEPFGLTMIESLACGTPVIAYDRGSVAEVLGHGRTAYIVNSVEEGARAVGGIASLSRRACRLEFERRFSTTAMIRRYMEIYTALISDGEADSRQMVNGSRSSWQKSSRSASSTMS